MRDFAWGRAVVDGVLLTGGVDERFGGSSQPSHEGADVARRRGLARGGAYVLYGARTRPGVVLVVLERFCCDMV